MIDRYGRKFRQQYVFELPSDGYQSWERLLNRVGFILGGVFFWSGIILMVVPGIAIVLSLSLHQYDLALGLGIFFGIGVLDCALGVLLRAMLCPRIDVEVRED